MTTEKIKGFILEGREERLLLHRSECEFCLFDTQCQEWTNYNSCILCFFLFPGLFDAFGEILVLDGEITFSRRGCPCDHFDTDFVVWRIEKFLKDGT